MVMNRCKRVEMWLHIFLFIMVSRGLIATNVPHDDKIVSRQELTSMKLDYEREIILGQIGTFAGHFKSYGDCIRHGMNAYFHRKNQQGGIKGKRVRLISMEDKGQPREAEQNVKALLLKKIDLIVGAMGTSSVLSLLPLLQEKKIGILFPWGGDERLRKPELTGLISGPGWMEPQIRELVRAVVNDMGSNRVALFHADSDFGIANSKIATRILKEYGIEPVETVSYNRMTINLDKGLHKLVEADPKTVICLSSSMPAARLINQFCQEGAYGTTFVGIDSTLFVGTILKLKGVEFLYTSSVPDPLTTELPIVQEYRRDLEEFYPYDAPNILSFSYYVHARIIVEALEKNDGNSAKDLLITTIEGMKKYDLGGFMVDFDPQTRYAYQHPIKLIKG